MISLSNTSNNTIYPGYYKTKDYPDLLYDQHTYQICVPFAISVIRHIQIFKRYGYNVIPDPIHIYYNRDKDMYQGDGMVTEEVLRYITKNGIPEISQSELIKVMKKCINSEFSLSDTYFNNSEIKDEDKIVGYKKLNSVDDIKDSILKYFAVIATVKHNEAIRNPDTNGTINYSEYETYDENHQVVILGWKENNWIIQNSYGKKYGLNGLAYLPMEYGLLEAYSIMDIEDK